WARRYISSRALTQSGSAAQAELSFAEPCPILITLIFIRSTRRRRAGKWVLELGIRKFFETLDHCHLRNIVLKRVRDGIRCSEKCLRIRLGKWAFSGVAWPRNAKPASPGVVGSALHSKPGLNFPFVDRLVLMLRRITIQNGHNSVPGSLRPGRTRLGCILPGRP